MVENILGTNVSSPIVPFTTADEFPTHDAKYGKGGFRAVQTISDRDNITDYRKDPGMFVYVIDTDKLYYLNDHNTWVEWSSNSGEYNVIDGIKVNGTNLTLDENKKASVSFSSTGNGQLIIKDVNNNNSVIETITIGNSGVSAGALIAVGELSSGHSTYIVQHSLGTNDLVVQVIDNQGYTVGCEVKRYTQDNNNYVRINFSEITLSAYKVILIGNPGNSTPIITT